MSEATTEELEMIRNTVRSFVHKELVPLEQGIEDADDVDHEVTRKLRSKAVALGIYGFNLPDSCGGPGFSVPTQAAIMEEVGYTSMPLSETIGNLPMSLTLLSAEQKDWLLPDVLNGSKTFTYALTEPDAGSDVASIKTRATRTNDGWILSGAKQFISNAETSDYILVLAATDPAAPLKKRLTTFIVERTNPGVRAMTRFAKMGWRGYHLNGFVLEDCFVPDSHVIGRPGDGFLAMMASVNHDRLFSAYRSLAIAQRAHDMACTYVKERAAFGKTLDQHQAIQFMIADNDVELSAARALAYQAAETAEKNPRGFQLAASRAKLYASEMAGRVTDRALQIFGGMGYSCELPIERFYRDARAFRIGEGTSEMQRIQIARRVLNQ
ncbi:acyl-CoA dehydrogenase family protein [Allomesorhizobium camelthorni]|uniref:Acyl-CoA/acyl-ACP dehydrogenase n=1 Tax=Allomesorhizobium camelthorni TaxID=475069 RepID=A0A6G4WFT5_9HYPH|nr:acyl-CoA dehydrogenase family protein [Mesorhizobium camelthorni]NGO53454.1 acyl-CoA/acyl-ACP dehydrogenase [Mesorhizobium camelthorni]